jgi:tyrosine-protein phosphatase SIW14
MKRPSGSILFFLFLFLTECRSTKPPVTEHPANWAQRITSTSLQNLFKVDDYLYRSEQPDAAALKELEAMGIGFIVDLRNTCDDKNEANGTHLILKREPINTWTISYQEVVNALRLIVSCDKPVLLHCKHGSDRTGCVVAAYRIVKSGWTKEEAIKEFVEGGYGYHEKWFPNILRLLKNMDVAKLTKDLEN